MKTLGIKTHKINPGENLTHLIDHYLPEIPNNNILAITSKIISLCQNRLISKKKFHDKFSLIQQEADHYLEGDYIKKYGVCLTLKNNLLIPTAGIDESNGLDCYLLYPKNIPQTAVQIWQHLKKKNPTNNIGVLITDSHTTPLRRGVSGIGLGWCGFKPLFNYIGKPDVFGSPLRATQTNLIDALAASAVLVMGEGNEQMPMALIEDAPKITFQQHPPSKEELESIQIPISEDLYAPLLESVEWKKGTKRPSPALSSAFSAEETD